MNWLFVCGGWIILGVVACIYILIQSKRWYRTHGLTTISNPEMAPKSRAWIVCMVMLGICVGVIAWPLGLLTYNFYLQDEYNKAYGLQ
jgi:hypothetical protein